MLPFYGKAYVAYVPGKNIIGLSKLARAVDIYSRRLQDQERITVQVAGEIDALLDAKGVAVMLEGQHFCNSARGVEQNDSVMKTVIFKGCFKDNEAMKSRFMDMARS
jgi:GTP cyclohydrolase I